MSVEKHYKSYTCYTYYYFVVIDNRGNPTFLQARDLHPRFVIKHKLRFSVLSTPLIISSSRRAAVALPTV